jgi:hypothetical protein
VCIADLTVIPYRSRNCLMNLSWRDSSSSEQASVCSWNGNAVTSILPSRTRSVNARTAARGLSDSQRSAGIVDSTLHRNLASSGHPSVASAMDSAESR